MIDFRTKEEDLISEYSALKPLLISWGEFVDKTILQILSDNGFDLSRLQIYPKHRIKTDNSLIRRAFYRDIESSSDPLRKIEDKLGTRLVVTTLDDVMKIREIITEHDVFWKSRESRGVDKHLSKPKEFDYQSLHLNLTPNNSVIGFEKKPKSERERYICELQVRTLLQHAFAQVAHDTIYKGVFGSDSQLVRILSRGAALMEVTDEHFCQAYKIMEREKTYEKNYVKQLITLSKERLDFEFQAKQVDTVLTDELFQIFDAKNIDIAEVERTIITNKDLIINTLNKIDSYMKTQPVLLFVIHLIFSNAYKIKNSWHLEEDILKDLFFKLGFSYLR